MQLTFYINSDDKRVIDKDPLWIGQANAMITKADCDILHPELECAYFEATLSGKTYNITNCNYFYVQEWDRYYFITGITQSAQRVFITGEVDILKSFASEIKKMDAVIERHSTQYDMYLNDKVFKARNYTKTVAKNFPKNYFTKNGSFILAVAGPQGGVT